MDRWLLCFGALLLPAIAANITFDTRCGASSSETTAKDCYARYKAFEFALVNNTANLYRLREAFIPYKRAAISILQIKYTIIFETQVCSNLSFVWSSSAVYTILSPPVLTLMQFQLPFSILRLFRLYLDLVDLPSGPEVAVFLWDGSFSLPSVSIDLDLHNVTSCPSQQEDPFFIDDLRDFTSMLKAYAISQESISSWDMNTGGYVLDKEELSPSYINGKYTGIMVMVGYLFWYGHMAYYRLFRITVSVIRYARDVTRMEEKRLLSGIARASVLLTIATVITEAVQTGIWLQHSTILGLLMLIGKVVPLIIVPGLVGILYILSAPYCYEKTRRAAAVEVACYMLGLVVFTCSFPTFLLLIVYPVEVLIVLAYTASFIYFFVILLSRDWADGLFESIFLFLPILVLLYATVIAQAGSLSSGGVYSIISLLPSIFYPVAAFYVRKVVLGESEQEAE